MQAEWVDEPLRLIDPSAPMIAWDMPDADLAPIIVGRHVEDRDANANLAIIQPVSVVHADQTAGIHVGDNSDVSAPRIVETADRQH